MTDAKAVNVPRLIAIPSVITLVVTILRVVGEIKHWPTPWVNTAAGGGGAILGIAWLPIIFGPYFAMKLAGAGDGPSSSGRAIGYAFLGLVVLVIGGALFARSINHPSALTLVAFIIMLGSAFVPAIGWRSLGRVLLGYALAARIPVLIVMYFAMMGNGGAGWGTHYDAVPPQLANFPVMTRYIMAGVMPQMTIWIGWTAIVGAICGGIAVAISSKGKHPAAVSA
jgi:hypothetical protein